MKKFISEFIPITEKIDKDKLKKDGYEIIKIGKFYRLRKLIDLEAINTKILQKNEKV